MKRAGRPLFSSLVLLLLGGRAAQGVASCADSEATPAAALDAGPQPDSATIIEMPDAPVAEPCSSGDAFCAVALPSSTPVSLNGVWGSSRDDVWIVGSPDFTLHWDGARLLSANASTRQTPFGIWGSGKDDVWSFSAGNAMWHSTGFEDGGDGGAGWSFYDGADGGGWPGAITAMWGRNANDVWAVGPFVDQLAVPTIWHCDGWRNGAPQWAFVNTVDATDSEPAHAEPLSFNAIWGNTNFEVWIVGMGGKTRYGSALDKSPGKWTPINSATSIDLNAVWGVSDGDVWAAGAGGTMRRFSRGAGGTWTASEVALPTTATIFGLYGFAANDIWAVGSAGTIVHWDGHDWKLVTIPGDAGAPLDDLFAVWGSGPADVWAVGRNTLLHRGNAPLPRKSP